MATTLLDLSKIVKKCRLGSMITFRTIFWICVYRHRNSEINYLCIDIQIDKCIAILLNFICLKQHCKCHIQLHSSVTEIITVAFPRRGLAGK